MRKIPIQCPQCGHINTGKMVLWSQIDEETELVTYEASCDCGRTLTEPRLEFYEPGLIILNNKVAVLEGKIND